MINGTIIGNVGDNPELRETPNGNTVAVFSVAVNNRRRNTTTWFRIEAWNGLGKQVVMPHVRKGDPIAVTIQDLRLETWNSREDGSARGQMVITANGVELLGGSKDNAE
ncbi:MAG: single-stranded DNA-binding protein [Chloroflexota bacterium]